MRPCSASTARGLSNGTAFPAGPRPGMVWSMSTGSKVGVWFVRKHPRKAARVGMTLARHPKRTVAAVKIGRAAPDIVRKARDAKDDPRLRDHVVETRDA